MPPPTRRYPSPAQRRAFIAAYLGRSADPAQRTREEEARPLPAGGPPIYSIIHPHPLLFPSIQREFPALRSYLFQPRSCTIPHILSSAQRPANPLKRPLVFRFLARFFLSLSSTPSSPPRECSPSRRTSTGASGRLSRRARARGSGRERRSQHGMHACPHAFAPLRAPGAQLTRLAPLQTECA